MVWSINHRKIILPLGVAFGESNFSFKSTTIDSCYPLLYIQTTKWGGPYTEVLCLAVAKELLLGVQLSEAMGSEGGGEVGPQRVQDKHWKRVPGPPLRRVRCFKNLDTVSESYN